MTELKKQYNQQKEAIERRQKEIDEMYGRLNDLLDAIAAKSANVKNQVEIAQSWLSELKHKSQKLGEYKVGLGEYIGVAAYGAEQFEEDCKNEPSMSDPHYFDSFDKIAERQKKAGVI